MGLTRSTPHRPLRPGGGVVRPHSVAIAIVLATVVGLTACSPGPREDATDGATTPTTTTTPTTATTTPTTTDAGCPAGPTTVAYRPVPGVAVELVSLDVHNPTGRCGQPVWIWVHGGGYRTGDKANQMDHKIGLAREQGWVLVSVNYRLTDPADPATARFPDHFEDVAAAVAWVHEEIAPLGGDPERLALFGHSAGADIVSNVAVVPSYLAAHGLGPADLACAGPLDTEGFDKVSAGSDQPDGEQDQWQVALGNDPDYLVRTSATLQVRPGLGIPPMIGVVRGGPGRQAIGTAFLDAVRATGVTATAVDARAVTHNQVNALIGAPGDTVMTPAVTTFLDDCFGAD
jgi:hypothetical protein